MPDVGRFLHDFGQWALNWLPLGFFLLTAAIVYLLWGTLKVMPRVSPTHVAPDSRSAVTWDDVAGVEEVRGELMEVVDFLRDPKRFERLGAKTPKGLLLYGPPGTGKTLLAKAVAHESGANFYSASASSFVEMFAGLGAARIRKLLVPPPDLKGREAILGVHTRGKPLGADVDLHQVAKQTSGLTGAELANI